MNEAEDAKKVLLGFKKYVIYRTDINVYRQIIEATSEKEALGLFEYDSSKCISSEIEDTEIEEYNEDE